MLFKMLIPILLTIGYMYFINLAKEVETIDKWTNKIVEDKKATLKNSAKQTIEDIKKEYNIETTQQSQGK